MNTAARKERERQERETRILQVARTMVIQDGYHGLSMDKIAAEIEYAKGTIYNHFSCKEEIIIALVIQTAEKRLQMFERAAVFRGRSRERLAAVGRAADYFVALFPEHFAFEQLVRSSSVLQKASDERRAAMRLCESGCMRIVGGIVRDAVAQGDLVLPEGGSPEDVVFGLWSMSFGGHLIAATSDTLREVGVKDPTAAMQLNYLRFLDGCGWRPLSNEHDYKATYQRIEEEVFSNEHKQLTAAT